MEFLEKQRFSSFGYFSTEISKDNKEIISRSHPPGLSFIGIILGLVLIYVGFTVEEMISKLIVWFFGLGTLYYVSSPFFIRKKYIFTKGSNEFSIITSYPFIRKEKIEKRYLKYFTNLEISSILDDTPISSHYCISLVDKRKSIPLIEIESYFKGNKYELLESINFFCEFFNKGFKIHWSANRSKKIPELMKSKWNLNKE